MKPHLLIPALSLLLSITISCKKNHPSPSTSTSPTDTITSTTPPSPALVYLRYSITYPEFEERTHVPIDENDPFAGIKPDRMQATPLLARVGLPLPEGSTVTHNGTYLFLTAPPDYHQKVATLLRVTGTPSPTPAKTDDP